MSWLQKLFYGVDPSQDQADMDAADAKLRKLNADKLASGDWTQEQFDNSEGNIARSHINAQAEVSKAFDDEVDARAKSFRDFFASVIAFPLKNLPKVIPWQVWVVAGVAVFVYMGGWKKLKGIIK
jgi:hypothetical protein